SMFLLLNGEDPLTCWIAESNSPRIVPEGPGGPDETMHPPWTSALYTRASPRLFAVAVFVSASLSKRYRLEPRSARPLRASTRTAGHRPGSLENIEVGVPDGLGYPHFI